MLSSDLDRWREQVLQATARALLERARPLPRTCTLCQSEGLFEPFGWPVRPQARCPRCGSLERHRLLKLWLDRNPAEIRGKTVLHFAPEPITVHALRPLAAEYLTADLAPGADLQLNIEDLSLPDRRFDVIICSHVLEHVDDRAALSEMLRVIKPGGLVIVMIPLIEGWPSTYENSAIASPADREIHFGQGDHVRQYGADFRSRAMQAGFELDEFTAVEPYVLRHGLMPGEKVFLLQRSGVMA